MANNNPATGLNGMAMTATAESPIHIQCDWRRAPASRFDDDCSSGTADWRIDPSRIQLFENCDNDPNSAKANIHLASVKPAASNNRGPNTRHVKWNSIIVNDMFHAGRAR